MPTDTFIDKELNIVKKKFLVQKIYRLGWRQKLVLKLKRLKMKDNKNFKKIHIGKQIEELVKVKGINKNRIENFFKIPYENIVTHFEQEHISTELLLKWCKLLKFDFFRYYSSHLMIYHGISALQQKSSRPIETGLIIRKNIYTPEIKQFILNKINNNEMDIANVIEKYGVAKTTIYRWLRSQPIK